MSYMTQSKNKNKLSRVRSTEFKMAERFENRPRSIYQYSSMAPRLSGKNCQFFKVLLSLNSQRRLRYKENNTKYRSLTWKPRSHVRILIYRTWPIRIMFYVSGRRGGLMVSALDSGASGPGSSPGRGHCVVFLGKTLYSHSASLHPGV